MRAASRRGSWRLAGRSVLLGVLVTLAAACARDDVAGSTPAAGVGGAASPVRSLVIVSLDTLRADRVEPYGYPRGTSPNLSGLARRAVVFEEARAQAGQTAPSHASLFTSQDPAVHGIVNAHGGHSEMTVLPEGVRTLAEHAAASGLETAAFVSGGNLTRRMGMDRGFSVWNERNEDIERRVAALLEWIETPGRGRFVALLHSYQVHAPYLPPAELVPRFVDAAYEGPLRARLERYQTLSPEEAWAGAVGPDYWEGMLEYTDEEARFLSDLYDAEIAYTDAALRPLLEALMTGPRAEDTALVVLSDHGEEFREHGKWQHDQMFEEHMRVPLMVRLPGPLERDGWRGRVPAPVELVDVAPTVAELLGLPSDPALPWRGRSLVPLMRPGDAVPRELLERPVYGQMTLDPGPKTYQVVVWKGWKLIVAWQRDLDVRWEWLFDLGEDPLEQHNLVDSQDPEVRAVSQRLRTLLQDHAAANADAALQVGRAGSAPLDAATRAELEQLGYLGDG